MTASDAKADAEAIFAAAVKAVEPAQAMRKHWNIDPELYQRIFVVGAGKAAAGMAAEAERQLGGRIGAGVVVTKYGHADATLKHVRIIEAGHPIPDNAGLEGADEIRSLARQAGKGDLLLCLFSGGASALLPCPVAGVSLEAKRGITSQLLARGATIHQMNTVRKHLSQIKGGQLASVAAPATVIAHILSDVVGDDLEVIASGPTAPDPTTIDDARRLMEQFGIGADFVPYLRETPKTSAARNVVIGSNRQALLAARLKARRLGYKAIILSSTLEGEAREVARTVAAIAREVKMHGHPVAPPACLIAGGETTVTLQGTGKGGRNQEWALAAAIAIRNVPGIVILSAGTDGTDGPTDAAGGIVDGATADDSANASLNQNDSYHYLKAHDALIVTGPTGTNVMDVQIALIH